MNKHPDDEAEQGRPSCFGDLQTVFPMQDNGLREVPRSCMGCEHKTHCLRLAVNRSSGAQVREEMVDRNYSGGVISFFQRWSQKKMIHRMKKNGE